MPAPECTCRMEINEPRSHEVYGVLLPEEWRVKVFLCPLHEAAPDLWIALAKLIDTLTWAGLRNPTLPFSLVAEDVLQAAIALRKANPQRTQEQKDDAK